MKKKTIFHLVLGLFFVPFFISCLGVTPQQAQAEDYYDSENESAYYSREELSQMLAPIALYPDALLSQVLMASTYPIEIIEADRWVRDNMDLQGEVLDDALLSQDWDPSVKAICHFPSILFLMSERIGETTNLGNAFLAQEGEVMDVVQELRAKAYAQNNLNSNSQQKVIVEKETIVIQPSDPRVIYVPYYDPYSIYGPWWYPAYPPYYWGPPGVSVSFGISYWPGLYFGFSFGNWCYFDWPHRYIYVDVHHRPRFVRHDHWIKAPGPWHHTAMHRRGFPYRDRHTAERYGQTHYYSRDYRNNSNRYPDHERYVRDRNGAGRRVGMIPANQKQNRYEHDNRYRDEYSRQKQDQQRQDRGKQDRERVEREKQQRDQNTRQNQEQQRQERGKQDRERVEREKKQRDQNTRQNQEQQRQERAKQDRERVEREKQQRDQNARQNQEQQRQERAKQDRERVEREKQQRDQVARQNQQRQLQERAKQDRERVEREKQQRDQVARQNQQRQLQERAKQDRERIQGEMKQREQVTRQNQQNQQKAQAKQERERIQRETKQREQVSRQNPQQQKVQQQPQQGNWNHGQNNAKAPQSNAGDRSSQQPQSDDSRGNNWSRGGGNGHDQNRR